MYVNETATINELSEVRGTAIETMNVADAAAITDTFRSNRSLLNGIITVTAGDQQSNHTSSLYVYLQSRIASDDQNSVEEKRMNDCIEIISISRTNNS